jgi:hypothetical protein
LRAARQETEGNVSETGVEEARLETQIGPKAILRPAFDMAFARKRRTDQYMCTAFLALLPGTRAVDAARRLLRKWRARRAVTDPAMA